MHASVHFWVGVDSDMSEGSDPVSRTQPSPGPPRPLDRKTCCKASKASKASKAWKASKAFKALDDKTSKASKAPKASKAFKGFCKL